MLILKTTSNIISQPFVTNAALCSTYNLMEEDARTRVNAHVF